MSLYHILPHTSGWCVIKSGNKRVSVICSTRRGAEKKANTFMKDGDCCVIHDDGGKIVDDFCKCIHL